MKKKLNTTAVINELKDGSAFFKQPEPTHDGEPAMAPAVEAEQAPQSPPPLKNKDVQKDITSNQESGLASKKASILTSKQTINEETKLENEQASQPASLPESLQESNEETIEDKILAAIAITPIKPNTFRYSLTELDFVRDAVYDAEVNYKTKLDKNDVVRIALEWLMLDYQEHGSDSFLVSILTRKKARIQGNKQDYFI